MNTVVLPAGWEHQAAPAATMLDRLGPPLAWWSAAVLLLALAVLLVERRPGLMVEDLGALLPAAQRQVRSEPNLMADFRPLTIVHAPEYRFDYLRDEIWIRGETPPAIPHPGAGPLGR